MSVRVACPYCNSGMTLAKPLTSRVTCARCGESFPVERAEVLDEISPRHAPSLNGDGHANAPTAPARGSHWPLAVLALTVLVATVGFGLWAIFRTPTKPDETPPTIKKISTFPPSALPTLKYLPAETNIAFAVQVGPLQEYADREKTDVKNVLMKAGLTESLLKTITDKGIKLEELSSLTGGLAIVGDALIPRFLIVVQFREEPDRVSLIKNLKATQFTAPSGATRYKVELGLPMELQILENKVFLFANTTADLDSAVKREKSDHLSSGLRDSMGQLSPASMAWLATANEEWHSKPMVKIAASLAKLDDLPSRLKPYRAMAMSVSLEPALALTVNLRGPEADGGAKLSEKLAANLAGKSDQVQFGSSGPWATVEVPLASEGLDFKSLFPAVK